MVLGMRFLNSKNDGLCGSKAVSCNRRECAEYSLRCSCINTFVVEGLYGYFLYDSFWFLREARKRGQPSAKGCNTGLQVGREKVIEMSILERGRQVLQRN